MGNKSAACLSRVESLLLVPFLGVRSSPNRANTVLFPGAMMRERELRLDILVFGNILTATKHKS
jgi:hypothetical protein